MSTTHRLHSWLHGVGIHPLQLAVTAQVLNPILLPFLQQEGDMLFSRTTCVHIWLLQHALHGVAYSCPRQEEFQISCLIEHLWDVMSGHIFSLHDQPQPLLNCNNRCKMLETVYHRMPFSNSMIICMREYKPVLLPEVDTLYIDVSIGVTSYSDECFIHSRVGII